ncbi:TPA: hypothetical protein ACG6D1_004892, partial [Escherichia coli]
SKERDCISLWISKGMRLHGVYEQLVRKYPELVFSYTGFITTLRHYANDLHKDALLNRSPFFLLLKEKYPEMIELANSGYSLKDIHGALFSHLSFSSFIKNMSDRYPDLHFQAKKNGHDAKRKKV